MIDPMSGAVTLQEYLEFERRSALPHEFRRGCIYALAEASGAHEQIKNNLVAHFSAAVKVAGCRLFSGGVKLMTPNGERAIPDFGVTCDPRDKVALDRSGEAVIEHPWLIVEILSPSTEKDDRGDKLDDYNLIRELTHYVLVDSRRRWLLVHERTADGLLAMNGPLERYTLPRLGELTLDIAYDGTNVARIA